MAHANLQPSEENQKANASRKAAKLAKNCGNTVSISDLFKLRN